MTQEVIINRYMEAIEKNGTMPQSMEEFCAENKIEEDDFYKEFDSFKSIDKTIFLLFFVQTNQLLENSSSFSNANTKEKLLSFYFTFFEVLTTNRIYVLVAFPTEIKEIGRLDILADFKKSFVQFISYIFEENISSDINSLEKIKSKTYEEGTWVQLLFFLNFWLRDTSSGFEKTDILIEKSLKVTFDIIDNTALKSMLDLGKFLFNEVKS